MKIFNSIHWLATWFAMAILKRSLHYRLKGEGATWLQNTSTNTPTIFNRIDFILDQCRNKKVLHIGFTDHPYTKEKINAGGLLHLHLQKVTTGLMGLDVEAEAIAQYTTLTNDTNVCQGDITVAYPTNAIATMPEVILLSEVLEHLTDPYKAIAVLHKTFAPGTRVLVTVPNYTALDNIAASLHHTESVHPHHHWYFSPYTLGRLFDAQKFKQEQLHFGMYQQSHTRVNAFLKNHPLTGDCIIAIFTITKTGGHE